jgi:FixJ family two-component response regulator
LGAKVPGKPVIAIVDDDPSVREGTMDLLNSMGFAAETFAGADEFLKSDRVSDTSCLIADMQMPGMTGLELYKHLVKSDVAVPTILITAFPNDKVQACALSAGVLCYLIKPFNASELLACIRSALERRQADRRG